MNQHILIVFTALLCIFATIITSITSFNLNCQYCADININDEINFKADIIFFEIPNIYTLFAIVFVIVVSVSLFWQKYSKLSLIIFVYALLLFVASSNYFYPKYYNGDWNFNGDTIIRQFQGFVDTYKNLCNLVYLQDINQTTIFCKYSDSSESRVILIAYYVIIPLLITITIAYDKYSNTDEEILVANSDSNSNSDLTYSDTDSNDSNAALLGQK